MRAGLIATMVLAGCSTSPVAVDLPAPACRGPADCNASGMRGAVCVGGRCAYGGIAKGRVLHIYDAQVNGPLHVVAYPAESVGMLGPACDAVPFGEQLVIEKPNLPYEFEIGALPWVGRVTLYAFVGRDSADPPAVRAERGDLVGFTQVSMVEGRSQVLGDSKAAQVDLALAWTADLVNDCD